jgi:Fe-S-cluster containining protein
VPRFCNPRFVPLDRKLTRGEIRRMKRLWDQVPPVTGCKGLCYDSCTNVPVFPIEAYYLIEKYGAKLEPVEHKGGFLFPTLGANEPCSFLNEEKRCTIYEDRPMICRMFGHPIWTLTCSHGCVVGKSLTEDKACLLMSEMVGVMDDMPGVRPGENSIDVMERQIGTMTFIVEADDECNTNAVLLPKKS